MVPTVYQRLVTALHTLISGVTSTESINPTDVWQPFIAEVIGQPAQHRYHKYL